MAIVKVMQGDLLALFKQGAFRAIAHGCNCRNLMDAGIAAQISEQFPEAYAADTEMYTRFADKNADDHDIVRDLGGNLSVAHTGYGQIFNLYTQFNIGRDGDYQLLERAMQNLNKFCKQRSISRVGVPLIGAGIAGLDIIAAMAIMNICTPDVDLVVVTWTGDQKSWEKASQFWNLSFPRKFDGAIMLTSPAGDAIVRRSGDDDWSEVNINRQIAMIMQYNGDRCISLSRTSPEIFLVIRDKAHFDENIRGLLL